MPSDYSQAMKDIGTLKNQMQRAYPDDSTIGENPWSSKNIVDMLCPPIEESGNPVVCYPVAGYPLGVKASWEPTQEGTGTPYPAGGGKNLWGDLIQNTFVSQQGGSSEYSGAKTTGKIPCTEGDKYTLSCATTFAAAPGNIGVLAYFDASDTMLTRIANTGQRAFTLTAPANAAYLRASCLKETDADNVQLEKGSTATDYAPYENIRPIKGRDSVRVERCGENLFDIAKVTETNILTKTDRQITLKAGRGYNYDLFVSSVGLTTDVPTNLFDRLPFFPKGTYKISYNATDPNARLAIVAVAKDGSITVISTNPQVDFTLSYGTLISIRCDIREEVTLSNIQITIGATAPTTYTPYIGSTNTLTLPETVYGGEVDAVTGDGKETWKTLTLDGTEEWGIQQGNTPGKFGFTFQVPEIATPTRPNITGSIVCNQYPTVSANDTYSCKNGISVEAQEHKYFRIYNDTYAGGTKDEWKAYLAAQYAAGTPVQVCYKLAEPVPFTATGAQALPALAGVNTVLTDANSMTVTGRADPIKRITDLEDATASQT